MIERIFGITAGLLISLVVLVQVFAMPGKEVLLGFFFLVALLLSIYYIKETGANIYALVLFLYALSFSAQVASFFGGYDFGEVKNLSVVANVLFAFLLFWTSRVLYKKIGGESYYVSITAIVLLAQVLIALFGSMQMRLMATNLYYVLLGLIATVKIKREIDEALIPAEQKILNLILLVIAYPISNLVVSTIKNL